MGTQIEIKNEKSSPDATVIRVAGELDVLNLGYLRSVLEHNFAPEQALPVILDLRKVTGICDELHPLVDRYHHFFGTRSKTPFEVVKSGVVRDCPGEHETFEGALKAAQAKLDARGKSETAEVEAAKPEG